MRICLMIEGQEGQTWAEWQALAAKGATKQRCLWASTSTKNPNYRDVMYVEGLIGPETVNTMPEETIRAFQDHGRVEETLTKEVDAAHKLLNDLANAGIDYDDVVDTLERVIREIGCPKTIRLDNGAEFISKELDLWAFMRGVTLDFSRPGKPTDNAFIESDPVG